jgi:hypothetical protein
MKSLKQFVVVVTFAALASIGLRAQTIDLRAAIPFDFHAGNRLMPAGEYQIHEDGGMVFLHGVANGGLNQVLMTIGATKREAPRHARLDFNVYGNEYFLAEVWSSTSPDGRVTIPPARQKELAKLGDTPAQVAVNLASGK